VAVAGLRGVTFYSFEEHRFFPASYFNKPDLESIPADLTSANRETIYYSMSQKDKT